MVVIDGCLKTRDGDWRQTIEPVMTCKLFVNLATSLKIKVEASTMLLIAIPVFFFPSVHFLAWSEDFKCI